MQGLRASVVLGGLIGGCNVHMVCMAGMAGYSIWPTPRNMSAVRGGYLSSNCYLNNKRFVWISTHD